MDRLVHIAKCILSLIFFFCFFAFISVGVPLFLSSLISCATVNTANGGSTISTSQQVESVVRNNSSDSSTTDVDISPTVDFSKNKK